MPIAESPTSVDIFCGVGGLSYGMKLAGVRVAAGIDIDPSCSHSFETNVGGRFIHQDVTKLRPEAVKALYDGCSVRVLSGCAPCQPFSSYASRYTQAMHWPLLGKFWEVASALRPEIVTIENVPRLSKSPIFSEFLAQLAWAGYCCDYRIVNCAEYGVPQKRKRLVLLASRLGPITMGPKTHEVSDFGTVQGAIGHLEDLEAGEASSTDPLHVASALSETNLRRIRHSKQAGTWRDWPESLRADCHTRSTGKTYPSVYGRMAWDQPAPTITTQFHGFGNGRFGHPEQDRAISLREGSLLQTFPETYSFLPGDSQVRISTVARMIGNAVPVALGTAIGRTIMSHLEEAL